MQKNIPIVIGVIYLLFTIACTNNSTTKPNIVLVLADDLGVPQVGCYGSSFYETPNIDKLAKNGIRFTNAYAAAAICSPTRAAILTGKNPARLHLTDFIAGNNNRSYPLLQPNWQKVLPLEEETIAEVLKQNGYRTGIFGKWHLSKDKAPPKSLSHNPDKQGFDESFITYKPANYLPIGTWQTAEEDGHSVDTLTNKAIDYIKRNKERPFFLLLSHNSIHDPVMEKQLSIEKFKNKAGAIKAENNPVIGAMVQRMDQAFGRLYQAIEQLSLLENTVIIFYSDNGAKDKSMRQTPFRKGKGWLYEGGIRVPFIVQWKGKIKANQILNIPVNSIDLFPTILHLTSSDRPINNSIDGLNLLPLLENQRTLPKRNFFWNYPHYHKGSGMKPACAIRSGDFKLIKWYENELLNKDDVYELYNLKEDVSETNNLATIYPEKVAALNTLLEDWMLSVDAQKPTINEQAIK